jgi:hypothetical protein
MRMIRWFLLNGAMLAALLLGFVGGVDGAKNVGLFIVWLCLPLSLVMQFKEVQIAMAKTGPPVPRWLEVLFDCAVIALLIWFGAWASGVAYTIHAALISAAYQESLKYIGTAKKDESPA